MTDSDFSQQLSKLSEIAAALNQETNSINDILTAAEAKIRALNVGLSAGVTLAGPDQDYLNWNWEPVVEDGRSRRNWLLKIDGKSVLLCTREQRIAALAALPELVSTLTAEAQSRLSAIQQAKLMIGRERSEQVEKASSARPPQRRLTIESGGRPIPREF
jgi:hypothetical protein